MRNNDVSSVPNDTVVVICTVQKALDDSFLINPIEVAFGKLDENGNDFYCIDSSENYESLADNFYNLDEGKRYYCFDRTIDELKLEFGENDKINTLMVKYFLTILKTYNVIKKNDKGMYQIYSISKEDLESKSDDPITEVNYKKAKLEVPSVVRVNTKTSTNTNEAYEEEVKPRINPLVDGLDLDDFEKYLKARVVRNDEVIENIATTIAMNMTATDPRDVENILSIGSTGSGKSYTFKVIGEYLSIPVEFVDCTQLSAAGYVGDSIEDYLKKVYVASEGNIDLSNRSILILDEFDKLKKSELDMKEAAQDSLLKLVEGHKYDVEIDKNRGTTVRLDSTGMTIVGCGAFSEIFEKRENGDKQAIGYKSQSEREREEKERLERKQSIMNDPYSVTDEELKEYGFKAEFIPRFQNRNVYVPLDEEGLIDALKHSKDSVMLSKIRRYLKQFNTELICDDSFVEAVAAEAIKLKCGGRSLGKVCTRAFKATDRELLKMDPTKKKVLRVTGETVKNNKKFDLK